MTRKPVTVSIVSHEHGDEIPLLLGDLAEFATPDIHEVIVTLNVPEPALAHWIEEREWPFAVSIVRNVKPLGFGANHNQAFGWCKSAYFCVLNPDIRLSDNPFPALLQRLAAGEAGCAYPLQSNGQVPARDLARELPTPAALLRRYFVPGYRQRVQPRHWINGAFMLLPSDVFMRLGGFDTGYYMYCEDVDFCLRLQARGYSIDAVSEAMVEHLAQHASRRRFRHFMWHVKSLWRLWHSAPYREFKHVASSVQRVI